MKKFEFISEAHSDAFPRDIYGGVPIVPEMYVAVVTFADGQKYLGFGHKQILETKAETPVVPLSEFIAEQLHAAVVAAGLGKVDRIYLSNFDVLEYTIDIDPEGDWRNPGHAYGFMELDGVPYLVQGYENSLKSAGAIGVAPEYELVDRLWAMAKAVTA